MKAFTSTGVKKKRGLARRCDNGNIIRKILSRDNSQGM